MALFEVLKFHIRRIITTPSIIGMLIGLPLAMILLMSFLMKDDASGKDTVENATEPSEQVATVVLLEKNNETLKQALIDAEFGENLWLDKEKAQQYLAQGKIGVVYTVPENYLMNLQPIKVQARNKHHRSNTFEETLRHIVYRHKLSQTLERHQLKTDAANQTVDTQHLVAIEEQKGQSIADFVNAGVLIIVLVIYIMMAGNIIGTDLVTLRSNNVLRRLITTPNQGWKIIGAILLSYTAVLLVINSLILFYIHLITDISTTLLLRSIWIIILAILFCLSYAVAVFRAFKNPNLSMNIGMVGFMMLVGLSFIDNLTDIQWVKNLSYLSPVKWMMDILDTGNWLVGTLIILLLSIVLFTAGSYKLENYVKRA
ncbi:ABC transporter permease [Tuanshanicoccus lijuaniae]|uniref:ABC transporter permease n=1 Tax=Aerococcaceae bacterium zg-1292 TaxID=2774330 RepID=UPI001BD85A00|nr:ABC transporter permease [Aerococcaceae bacterium zg-A91]MBS4458022.1 ABC transporter permease [Aerococcaceae bacterium zg-BR33]